ncbi:MAG: tRNA (N(6)-L-threonylcarbamoyladenosine(37)-C(2))-methylthiotransferase MtaB [Clostridiales bacterium]|nr:tRNA (N(6)-L-threonylcarbamoyladenosine(37)-C(2))-methylthiotransferase MtaB [Clostridiales bacterium]
MRSVAFHTLGCKVNQYDSQAMLELFEEAGYEIRDFSASADVYVINTCTVTGTGDKKSLQAVRRVLRQNPAAHVVIAGCLAQRDGEKLLSTGARLVIGNARRKEVVSLLEEAIDRNQQIAAVSDILRADYEPLSISRHEGHTRAVLKIQEGCDRYCTYCIIPYVRGGIRSRKPADIRAEAERLAKAGFVELVLTGIHLTSYGRDLENETLLDAIRACDVPGVQRIRLGSLEPVIVTEDFVSALQKESKVCPQFHLALQSGCDSVLKRMRRRYTTEEFDRACALLRAAFPGCAITTDVIAGFPGETEEEFMETMAFCQKIGFARMHVFPYSARQGTPAAQMSNQVQKAIREERARQLIAVGNQLAKAYMENQLGTIQEVLAEECENGLAQGYTGAYISCHFPGGVPGQVYPIWVTGLTEEGLTGEIAD